MRDCTACPATLGAAARTRWRGAFKRPAPSPRGRATTSSCSCDSGASVGVVWCTHGTQRRRGVPPKGKTPRKPQRGRVPRAVLARHGTGHARGVVWPMRGWGAHRHDADNTAPPGGVLDEDVCTLTKSLAEQARCGRPLSERNTPVAYTTHLPFQPDHCRRGARGGSVGWRWRFSLAPARCLPGKRLVGVQIAGGTIDKHNLERNG